MDYNGNEYTTVQIGFQCWMRENLKVRHYRNGIPVPEITATTAWSNLTSGARCWYQNDSSTFAKHYGALYNWFAVTDSNGLCPQGWHVPTDADWQTLETYLGMTVQQATASGSRGTDEGGKLKSTSTFPYPPHPSWSNPNAGSTNISGFTALPGGLRYDNWGFFHYNRIYGYWWSSSSFTEEFAWNRVLSYNSSKISRYINYKYYGFSVRCVKSN